MNNLCLKLKKSYLFKDIDLEILENWQKDLKKQKKSIIKENS